MSSGERRNAGNGKSEMGEGLVFRLLGYWVSPSLLHCSVWPAALREERSRSAQGLGPGKWRKGRSALQGQQNLATPFLRGTPTVE